MQGGLPGCPFLVQKFKNNKFCLFLDRWPVIFGSFAAFWPFLKSLEVYIVVKIQNFSFFKTDFCIFQLHAPGNSDFVTFIRYKKHRNTTR